MNFEEMKPRRIEITLYRCSCKHCDTTVQELNRLAKQYGAFLDIKRIDKQPGFEDYPGWRTPLVYINGRQITHYEVSPKKWEEALKEGRAAAPSMIIGEIVDIHCYLNSKAKGSEHRHCAEECIEKGQPIGLVTRGGELYVLMEDPAYRSVFHSIRNWVSEEVRITGDVCERGGVQGIMVRNVESVSALA